MPLGIGPLELVIVLAILIVIFGPKRLPGLGRSLGTGMREFKDSVTGSGKDDDDQPAELSAAPVATTTAAPRREPEVAAVEADAARREKDPSGSSA
jgi:sec-independent protein translocase protein TatA